MIAPIPDEIIISDMAIINDILIYIFSSFSFIFLNILGINNIINDKIEVVIIPPPNLSMFISVMYGILIRFNCGVVESTRLVFPNK